MSLFNRGTPPGGQDGQTNRDGWGVLNALLVYTGSASPQPIDLTDSGIAFPGTVSIRTVTGLLKGTGGLVDAVAQPTITPGPYTNPSVTVDVNGLITAIVSGSPSNISNGFSINVTNPTIGADVNNRRCVDLLTYYDLSNINTGFTTAAGQEITIKPLAGQNSYGSGTNAKSTFVPLIVNNYGFAQGQRFCINSNGVYYGMGDAFSSSVNVQFAGGPIAGDEGQGFWSVSRCEQQTFKTLLTLTMVYQTSTYTHSITQDIVGSSTPQIVTVNSTIGINVGDWIVVYPYPPNGYPKIEAVLITAIAGNTITGVFMNNQVNGTVFAQALVIGVDDSEFLGEGRVLINLSGASYTAGTVSGITGSTFTGSGTAWAGNMVGGDGINIGAISLDADTNSGAPFNGSGVNGPLRSWYLITGVASNTSLTIHSFTVAGNTDYRGNGPGSGAYQIRPAVRVLRILNTLGQGPAKLVCAYTTGTWSVGHSLELSICPYPDINGFDVRLGAWTPGASCRSLFAVSNSGSVQFQNGFTVTGNCDSGFFANGGQIWGARLYGSRGALTMTWSTAGQLDWNGGYLRPNPTSGGFDWLMEQGNAGNPGGILQSCSAGYAVAHGLGNQELLCFTGGIQVASYQGGNQDGFIRLGIPASPPNFGFGLARCFDFQYRHYTPSPVFGAIDCVDLVYHKPAGGISVPFSFSDGQVAQGAVGTATSGANFGSGLFAQAVSIWNGSSPQVTSVSFQAVPEAGNNAALHWQVFCQDVVSALSYVPLDIKQNGILKIGTVISGGTDHGLSIDPTSLTLARTYTCPDVSGIINVGKAVRLVGQTTASSPVTQTVGSADASYEVGANVNVTAATTASFTVVVTYTDETNTARTATLTFTQAGVAAPIQTITNTTGVGAYSAHSMQIRCKSGTTITVSSVGTFTSVTYNIEGLIKQVS